MENPEQLFGGSRYLPLSWYKTGLKRAEAVAHWKEALRLDPGSPQALAALSSIFTFAR